jgi:hypothetical protein
MPIGKNQIRRMSYLSHSSFEEYLSQNPELKRIKHFMVLVFEFVCLLKCIWAEVPYERPGIHIAYM